MKGFIIVLQLLILPTILLPQDIDWRVDAPKTVKAYESFEVSYILNGSKGSNFSVTNFEGLEVISGPSSSYSMTIINGKGSSTNSWTFTLMATKEGQFTLPSASIVVNNITHRTNPTKINVLKGNKLDVVLDDQFFMRLELSDSIVYVGQQVTLSYNLYTVVNPITTRNIRHNTEFDGMYTLSHDQGRSISQIKDGEKIIYKRPLYTISLFPQRTGKFYIEPAEIIVSVPKNSRSIFTSYTDYVVKSNDLNLNVIDLPAPTPDSYSGAVGDYEFGSAVSTLNATTDDAITFQISVKGNGDLKKIMPPSVPENNNWDIYEPNIIDEKQYVQGNEIISYRKFEYLLTPRSTGTLEVAPSFTYFDLHSNRYVNAPLKPVFIEITQGNKKIAQNKIVNTNDKLRPLIQTNGNSINNGNPFLSIWYLSSMASIGLFFLGLIYFKRKSDELDNLPESVKKRNLLEAVVNKRLKASANHLSNNNGKEFYTEIALAINSAISESLDIQYSSLTKDSAIDKLIITHGDKVAEDYKEIHVQCEMALFAGQNKLENMQHVFEKANKFLLKILK